MRFTICAAGVAAMALGVAALPAVDNVDVKDAVIKERGIVGDLVKVDRRRNVYPRATKTAGEHCPSMSGNSFAISKKKYHGESD